MECPKCGAEIDKSAMVCPNCKKVLKIICPVCRTVNTKNTCKKCGEILVVKCAKCGKINLTKNSKCVKCGYSNEVSAVQGESNTETFALLKIEFPNSDVIKAKLGSNQLYTKFKQNLDNMIVSYLNPLHVRRQITKDGVYIIRFNNVYTPSASANSAITASIELINMFTKLNVKLLKRKQIGLKCNLTIMQRTADGNPYDIDSGFQADMVSLTDDKEQKALTSCQVITDEDFYDYYNEKYKLESLNAVMVKGKMKQFYEINLKEYVKIKEYMQQDTEVQIDEDMEVPQFVQTALLDQEQITRQTLNDEHMVTEDELYNIELINFDEINCAFFSTENIRILDNVIDVLQEVPRGIIAIKGSNMYQPYTLKLLSAVDETGIYDNIIPITCHDDMKYAPYSFFRELVSSIFEYTVSQKLFDTNDFSAFSKIDSSNLVKDLVTMTQRNMNNFEDTRDKYFQVFVQLLQAIPNSLIYIENFEKIDSSSLFVLEQLFEHFEELNVSYLITHDKDFTLHKHAHFLLSRPFYTEITLKPAPFEGIVEMNKDFYKNILNDFYFQRIAKYACGSSLFLDFAIQYLLESGVYSYTEYSIVMVNPKTIIIPSSLSKLIGRRLNLLKDDFRALKFLTMAVLLGTRVDTKTIDSFGFANWKSIADKLAEMGYIYFYNDCMYFSNYSLLRENILEIIKPDELKEIAQELYNVAFAEDMASPVKAYLYSVCGDGEKVIFEWEKLANINLSMGDFPSYLNCSGEIINALDKYASNWEPEELEKYKTSIYENISNNMFEYDPDETREVAEGTLANLQKNNNEKSFIELGTKMIQGALYNGEYMYALTLTHQVLSAINGASIDPAAENFDLNFLTLSIIHVRILFNVGAYDDCLDIGYNVLNVLDSSKIETIKFTNITKQEFKELINECIACIAIADVVSLKEDVHEFLDISKKLFNSIPAEFSVFVQLQNLIKGQTVSLTPNMEGNNIYASTTYHIVNAFAKFRNNPTEFAKEIYKSKLIAKETGLYKFELFVDLLIGYSYIQLNSFKKAHSIIHKVIDSAREYGMYSIEHIAGYVMSILEIRLCRFDIAYGILNNSTIQMEKNPISEYLTMLHKVNMYKVLMCCQEQDKAQICMDQAKYIVEKYGLNFNLNIDIKKLMMDNQNVLQALAEAQGAMQGAQAGLQGGQADMQGAQAGSQGAQAGSQGAQGQVTQQAGVQTPSSVQTKEESLSERENSIPSSGQPTVDDSDFVNPEDFFS